MGEMNPDQCIFCKADLEEWYYEHYKENGERASGDWRFNLNICKKCAWKLKNILDAVQEDSD